MVLYLYYVIKEGNILKKLLCFYVFLIYNLVNYIVYKIYLFNNIWSFIILDWIVVWVICMRKMKVYVLVSIYK